MTSFAEDKRDLTTGSVIKKLIFISIPIILSNLLQTAYNITDTFWIGRLGKDSVAAVSISFPLIFLIIALGMGITISGTILVSQYKGMKDSKNIDFIAGQTIMAVFLISLVLTIVSIAFSNPLLRIIGTPEAILPIASSYFNISAIGFIFVFGFMAIQSLMRGAGEVKIPLYIVLFTVILNFLLDPLFIFGYGIIPAMGASGAAIATIGTQGIATLLGLFYLAKGKYGIHLKKENFIPHLAPMKRILALGLPTSLEHSFRSMGLIVSTALFASFGTVAVAAYGISTRIFSFVFIPALGIAIANTAMIGQTLGARKTERVREIIRKAMMLSFSVLFILGIFSFIFSRSLIGFFIPHEPEVIAEGTRILRFLSVSFGFIGIQLISLSTFRGAGKTGIALILSLISMWAIQIPLAVILSRSSFALTGLIVSYPISDALGAMISVICLKRCNLKSSKLIHDLKRGDAELDQKVEEESLEVPYQ